MVIGGDPMSFNQESYELTRSDVLIKVNDYLEELRHNNENILSFEMSVKSEEILNLKYNELLILQSSIEQWERLMNDSELKFRRMLCAKLYNLTGSDISIEFGRTSGAISNLFNKDTLPKWPRPFQLTVLFNHPWQLINKINPDKYSYPESPEYFHNYVADRIELKDLGDERAKVKSIRGYVIINAGEIFPQESEAITGRWVITYKEFDYFEFHLNHEPLIDKKSSQRDSTGFPAC